MNRKNNSEKGFTFGEVVTVIVVIVIVALTIRLCSGKKKDPRDVPPEKPKYKSLTSKSGLIPLKVVTTNPNNVVVYNNPHERSRSRNGLGFFTAFFILDKKNGFYKVGTDPFSEQSLGWIKMTDGIEWSHKEALELKINPNAPVYIWKNKTEIGNIDKAEYEQRTDNPKRIPYPMLDADGDKYKIALTWQTQTWDGKGVDAGWTAPLKTPKDAEIVCYITRHELEKRMVKILATLKDLENKPYSDHPIIKLFKEDLGITFGKGLDLEDESIGFLKKIAEEAPKLPGIFEKQPAEIRSEFQKMWRTFDLLRAFYENSSNWDKRGGGWIPLKLIPGN
jgi:hypothetical protein